VQCRTSRSSPKRKKTCRRWKRKCAQPVNKPRRQSPSRNCRARSRACSRRSVTGGKLSFLRRYATLFCVQHWVFAFGFRFFLGYARWNFVFSFCCLVSYDSYGKHWMSLFFQLSACVCGVATAIISCLGDGSRLEQFAEVGILYEVESLLSTYGNELGMLQVSLRAFVWSFLQQISLPKVIRDRLIIFFFFSSSYTMCSFPTCHGLEPTVCSTFCDGVFSSEVS